MANKKTTKSRKKKSGAKKRTAGSRSKATQKAKGKAKTLRAKPKKGAAKPLALRLPKALRPLRKKAGKTAAGAALKSLYASGGAKPNLEFEKQFESELESFDETKHSVPGGSAQAFEEEEEEISPEPPRDEELFDYDDEDLEY